MAAADLLGVLLRRYPSSVAATDRQMRAASWVWPSVPRSQVCLVHRTAAGQVEPHFLARLVERVPQDGEPEVDAYLAVLDRALLDRHLSATEADELLDVAHELGLHRGDVVAVHIGYLRELARAAWADRVVTAEERRDIEAVAALESADVGDLFRHPRHPYTAALLGCVPHRSMPRTPLPAIEGAVPDPGRWPAGCHFEPRCRLARRDCAAMSIPVFEPESGHHTRCLHHDDLAEEGGHDRAGARA